MFRYTTLNLHADWTPCMRCPWIRPSGCWCPPSLLTQPPEAAWCIPFYLCAVFGLITLDCGDAGCLEASPGPACQHALIWMFLFYCVFVCVCILCSVVYQDGFYGADIYVSIMYWYDIACYTAISVVSALLLRTCKIIQTNTKKHCRIFREINIYLFSDCKNTQCNRVVQW